MVVYYKENPVNLYSVNRIKVLIQSYYYFSDTYSNFSVQDTASKYLLLIIFL